MDGAGFKALWVSLEKSMTNVLALDPRKVHDAKPRIGEAQMQIFYDERLYGHSDR